MKKNVLALSITAALVGLTGSAHAMTGALGGATAGVLEFNAQGVGHSLIVPYFSTQGNNATLLNIVNTDMANGKAVKVRFRGAANSDDLYDFQVFLSPGDVWTATVTQSATGESVLMTADASCTKPAKAILNAGKFSVGRLDGTLSVAAKNNGTREGYVEIFTMADVPKAIAGTVAVVDAVAASTAGFNATATVNPLFTAIKHVNKVAPCDLATGTGTTASAAAWTYLDSDTTGSTNLKWDTTVAAATTPRSAGLLPPTTGLMANWTIINVVGAAAWSGEAAAVEARDVAGTMAVANSVSTTNARANQGNVVYWPQTAVLVDAANATVNVENYSADALFRKSDVFTYGTSGVVTAATAGALAASFYDLPDMSTPTTTAATTPLVQAKDLTASLATKSVRNEFLTDSSIAASTDWVFSMPTRRYSTAFDYSFTTAATATNDGRRFTNINADATFTVTAFFAPLNTTVSTDTNGNGRQICVKHLTGAPITIMKTDREETLPAPGSVGVVISPAPLTPVATISYCGEASVLSINRGGILAAGTGSLKAAVAVQDIDATYVDGWMGITTPAGTPATLGGLPVMGGAFMRAANGAQTFGIFFPHRKQR